MERAFRPERLDVADPAPRPLPLWGWAIAATLIVALAIGGSRLKPADADLAAWWPAVGAGVWLVLRAGLDRRWAALAVVLVAAAASLSVGCASSPADAEGEDESEVIPMRASTKRNAPVARVSRPARVHREAYERGLRS